MAKSRLHELAARGQSIWFDTLSRDLVPHGELKRMMDQDAVTGVTSNPTIFQKALSPGDAYDEDMKKLLAETRRPDEIFFSLALQDIRDALRRAEAGVRRVGRRRRLRVDGGRPGLAYDTEGTFEQAPWIAKEVERPNLLREDPGDEPGLPAIEDSIAHGTSINITLIFSLERYEAVVEAYLRGSSGWSRAAATRRGRVGRLVLRLARRHRGRQAARGRRAAGAAGQARDREREARYPHYLRRSPASAGSTSKARARRSSAASGRRRRRRTRLTAT